MQPSGQSKSIKLRFVTATSLFDGHDASINIIRRLLQQAGAEVIHLGHNRSVREIVDAAIQEGVHAIAISSYQGGHIEYFKYMKDLLSEKGVDFIRIFGGGGGVIVPEEIHELEAYGITRIYSPEDGQRMGLNGIIDDMMQKTAEVQYPPLEKQWEENFIRHNHLTVSHLISMAEADAEGVSNGFTAIKQDIDKHSQRGCVIGITGTGGSGKSSLEDEIIRRFLHHYPEITLAILAADPTKKKTGGALLGDRIRMNALGSESIYMRSLATRSSQSELPAVIRDSIGILRAASYDIILVETPGIGQGNISITDYCDLSIYVMTSEYGAPSQLEKIDMLDYADMIIINKFDHSHSLDALRDVRKQYRRNHNIFDCTDEDLPIYGTVASNFNDPGVDLFFRDLVNKINLHGSVHLDEPKTVEKNIISSQYSHEAAIIPPDRDHYLAEIADTVRSYHRETDAIAKQITVHDALQTVRNHMEKDLCKESPIPSNSVSIPEKALKVLEKWESESIRHMPLPGSGPNGNSLPEGHYINSLSGIPIPLIALPRFSSRSDLYRWLCRENIPGQFPYTSGVFPLRRQGEDPKRQFAGEGTPERTNKRFHYLTRNDDAKRLSTAFDSVTLYGEDPSESPDIFGKIGESGVSICTLDDMKKLYHGFDLCSPSTSVSMTINGPAPVILAFFFNTAIDQQVEQFIAENGHDPSEEEKRRIHMHVLENIRGTVQADILKEDQGQNSCIFATGFALKMMGDIQEYFIRNNVRNFYSVSISGYHIAEAGANPVTQLAFTLANAFTYVEYYISRGMNIDDFAANLSFFFSSGMEPEYNVLIRVARRIWAIAMKNKYGANEKSQRLKCHIQTSGRSLHAQEMQFNDIRTTLQALMALNDNCNSLHTNSYDEAVTTPTEESVRRAMAIQLIIGKEYGLYKNQNPNQGSFVMEYLTDAMEEAVLREFESLSQRGGVLGSMESFYQRGKIQEESLEYEHKKHTGSYPIIGVNTYLNPNIDHATQSRPPVDLTRASYDEKMAQITNLKGFQSKYSQEAEQALVKLKNAALSGKNIFEEMMNTARYASLGQITSLLYMVGGKYRRNM